MRRFIRLLTRAFAWIVLLFGVTATGVMYFVSTNLAKREVSLKFDIHTGDVRQLIKTCVRLYTDKVRDSGQLLRSGRVIQVNGKDAHIGLAMRLPVHLKSMQLAEKPGLIRNRGMGAAADSMRAKYRVAGCRPPGDADFSQFLETF